MMTNIKMNRRDFLKKLLILLSGILIAKYNQWRHFIPLKLKKQNEGKEAKYYKQADHLAG